MSQPLRKSFITKLDIEQTLQENGWPIRRINAYLYHWHGSTDPNSICYMSDNTSLIGDAALTDILNKAKTQNRDIKICKQCIIKNNKICERIKNGYLGCSCQPYKTNDELDEYSECESRHRKKSYHINFNNELVYDINDNKNMVCQYNFDKYSDLYEV